MSEAPILIGGLLVILALLVCLGLMPLWSPPMNPAVNHPDNQEEEDVWSERISRRAWILTSTISIILASLSVIFVAFHWERFNHYSDIQFLGFLFATGLAVLVFVQSLVTDVSQRMVDRRLLNFASLALAPTLIFAHWTPPLMMFVGGTLLFAFVLYIFVMSIGASDIRALVFITLTSAAMSPSGLMPVAWAFTIMTALFFVAGISYYKRGTVPAVPIIVFPFMLILVTLPVLDLWNTTYIF